jgi:ribosomal protein L24E
MATSKTRKKSTERPEAVRALCGTALEPGHRVVYVHVDYTSSYYLRNVKCSKKRYTVKKATPDCVTFTKHKSWSRTPKELIVVGYSEFHTTPNGEECDCVGW